MTTYEYRPNRPAGGPSGPQQGKGPPPPPPTPAAIVVTQKNPAALSGAHSVTNPAVIPHQVSSPPSSFRFQPVSPSADIHEFLFEVKKGSSVFWVGAAVPKGVSDFTRAQVYFHPTVVQNGTVHAADGDYREFKGGWSGSLQRYVAMQGGQFAAAGKRYPMIFPFTTMAALQGGGHNMFTDRPVVTLNGIMDAIRDRTPGATGLPNLTKIGVASFSSGIMSMRRFINDMKSSGLIREVIDFDSPFITIEAKALTPSPGAVSKCYTQHQLAHPPMGWVQVSSDNFKDITAFRSSGLHAQIGWTMYHQAMVTSVI